MWNCERGLGGLLTRGPARRQMEQLVGFLRILPHGSQGNRLVMTVKMRGLVTAIFATYIVCFCSVDGVSAQARSRRLQLGESVELPLARGERHAFAVSLSAGSFAFITVKQHGIDAYVSVLNSSGEVVAVGDGQGGENGMESVAFYPDASGWYWIAVLPRRGRNSIGTYTITLERLEPAAASDDGRVDQLFAAWDRPGSPGAAVTVVRNGEIVHTKGYGLANLEYDIPIEPSTVFHIASVSKQFTAFAVLLLAVEGRLSLDDDIRTFIPELHDFGQTITIRHLLHHTSGLRDQWSLLTMGGWRMDDVITRDQIFRLVMRQRELNFEPGAEYLYTNTGFTLLAEIVERVTGQDFRAWTTEHIFAPLGMDDTHFHDDHQELVRNRAYSYQDDPAGTYKKAVLSYSNVGATSVFSTAEDLSKWTANFETGAVGGPGLIRLMRSRGALDNGDSLDYAMGQAIGTYRGMLALYHAGADAGFRSYLLRFPHQRLGVVVLSNLASIDAGHLARQVAEVYLEDEIAAVAERTGPQPEDDIGSPTATPARFGELIGEYDLGTGVVMAISRDGNRLLANASGQRPVTLVPLSSDRYLVEGSQQYIQFARDTDGIVTEIRLEEPGSSLTAPRVNPFDAETVRLTDYAGTFHSEELGATYVLEVEADTLFASHLRLGSFGLHPRGPDRFVANQWFIRDLRFQRDRAGRISGFRVSNDRVRGLLFEKRR